MPCNRLPVRIIRNLYFYRLTPSVFIQALAFHENLTEAKIANKLVVSFQSLDILHLN